MCILFAGAPRCAAIKQLEGNAAVVEISDAPGIGTCVELHHPEWGVLTGSIVGRVRDTVRIAFKASDRAARFAAVML